MPGSNFLQMINTIPLVMAVLLGLAAVFAVNRTLARSAAKQDKTVAVVVANRELEVDSKIDAGACGSVVIPMAAYLEGRHVPADQIPRIEGLPVSRRISTGDHILWDDLKTETGGMSVGKGEFLVELKFQNSPLLEKLRPLDEIAIAAMQTVEETERTETNLGSAPRVRTVQRLTVLFPRVKVLSVSRGTVSVSAPPEQALRLQMASLSFPLYPFLRRTGDTSNDSVGVGGSVASSDLSVENLSSDK